MIKKNRYIKNKILTAFALLLSVSLAGVPLSVQAKVEDDAIYTEEGFEDYQAERERNAAQDIQTNLDPAWPQGPAVGAAGAVVMDAESGAVLYGKNQDKQLFPASITKLMTALLSYENLDPDDTVTFSENAVFGIEFGSSNIGMDVGESITVDEALYGLMVASANEVAIALGERVSGTESDFVSLMNQRAAELGCKNTHFVNPNGLHDSDHYTTAYDMALIAREIYKYPDLIEYMSQLNYHFLPSKNQPDDFWILNTNDFLNNEFEYDAIVGGKTGYTDQARETLVSFAERDGKKLICVIMREEPPFQYFDTVDLLNYAFDNFKQIKIVKEENRFTQTSADFLSSGPDIFGTSTSSFYINEDAMLTVPKSVSFSDLTAEITPALYESSVSTGADSTDSSDPAEAAKAARSDEAVKSDEAAKSDKAAKGSTADTADTASTQSAAGQAEKEPLSPDRAPVSLPRLENGDKVVGFIQYKYHDYSLGSANVLFRSQTAVSDAESGQESSDKGSTAAAAQPASNEPQAPTRVHGIKSLLFGLVHTGAHGSVYLNILLLMPLLLAVTFLLCILIFVYDHFAQRSSRRKKQKRRAQRAKREYSSNTNTYDEGKTQRPAQERRSRTTRRYPSESDPAGSAAPGRSTYTRRGTDTGRNTNTSRRTVNTGRTSSAGRSSRPSGSSVPGSSGSAGTAKDRYPDRRGSVSRRSQGQSDRYRTPR